MLKDPLKAPYPGLGEDHPDTYWAATAGPLAGDDGPLKEDMETDVAIIGGGYTGLSTAYFLAREYGIRAVVLEANRPGWGCSGRNGSFVMSTIGRHGYDTWVEKWGMKTALALYAEGKAALATVHELIDVGGIDCDCQPEGLLKMAHRPSRITKLEAEQKVLAEVFGGHSELLDAQAIADTHFQGAEAYAALRTLGNFTLHPLKLLNGVLILARAAGAVVHGASPVINWSKDSRHHVLMTPGGRVRAKRVVMAGNGYTFDGLHKTLRGCHLPVLSNIIVTRPMSATELAESRFVSTDAMLDTRHTSTYFRRLPDNRVMMGGRGPITATPSGLAAHRQALLNVVRTKFPALGQITADYFWDGWVNVSYDYMPHIHHAKDDVSVHYAGGYTGKGVAFSLHAGRLLAASLTGNSTAHPRLPFLSPMPRYPLAAFRRLGQRALLMWYRYLDEKD
ncbi:MAG: FAD-binding oxidoreductase [Rhodospirillaceae bacterium]|nr:FAD-binding oxidoreductase [Rhodospirillaceae bacterium]